MLKYLDEETYSEFHAFLSQDDRVLTSVLSSARVALDLWSDPDIVNFTKKDSLSIEALRNEKTIIYLIVPEHKTLYLSLLLNLVYSACFEFCSKITEGNSVFFFLDEF